MGKAAESVTDYLFTDRDIASAFSASGMAPRQIEVFSSDYAAMKRTRDAAATQIDDVQDEVDALELRVDAVEADIVRIDAELVIIREDIEEVRTLAIIGIF
jgi:septal ring factor EnvC (AmiA/AmiB activator)